jgi:hypothetical protein
VASARALGLLRQAPGDDEGYAARPGAGARLVDQSAWPVAAIGRGAELGEPGA